MNAHKEDRDRRTSIAPQSDRSANSTEREAEGTDADASASASAVRTKKGTEYARADAHESLGVGATPGPWHVNAVRNHPFVSSANGERIADCGPDDDNWLGWESEEQADANARLIAAAPELLIAAKLGLASTLALSGRAAARGEYLIVAQLELHAVAIRAAIAKAEGLV